MKSKVIYLLTALAVLVLALGFSAADTDNGPVRVLQHETTLPEGPRPKGDLVTHLPILSLDTGGQKIPGTPIVDDIDPRKIIGYETGTNGELEIPVSLAVWDKEGEWNSMADPVTTQEEAHIRYRGNSSRFFDKKSCLLRLTEEHPLLGMASASEWVLHGPFLDRTLVRNYVCYSVAGQIMEYAPNARYCELVLDGEYQGVYLLVDAITKDDGRVDLTEPEPGRPVTSWLVRWDRTEKGDTHLDTFCYYTFQSGVSILDLRYPGKNTVTPERIAYVEEEISEIERVIHSADFQDAVKGYPAYLDTDAFAQYFVINEFFGNVDAGRFSTYLYKDMRGKVTPVVWDFNNGCDNYISYVYDGSGFTMTQSPWFGQLLRDEDFVDEVIRQYRTLRRTVLSDEYLARFIDNTVSYLGDAAVRNYDVWGYVFDLADIDDVNYLYPVERNYESYEEAVSQLKGWLAVRGAWLDEHIETLRQYCAPSKNAARTLN